MALFNLFVDYCSLFLAFHVNFELKRSFFMALHFPPVIISFFCLPFHLLISASLHLSGEHHGADQSGGHHHLHGQEKVHHVGHGHQSCRASLRADEV